MQNIDKIVAALKSANQPLSDFVQFMEHCHDPYIVLIACILSLRTNDKTTYGATLRMLELGKTPEDFAKVDVNTLEKAIYPVGFYKNKAQQIVDLSKQLVGKSVRYNFYITVGVVIACIIRVKRNDLIRSRKFKRLGITVGVRHGMVHLVSVL